MNSQHLDARGLICPLPVLKAQKALRNLQKGDTLTVTATDDRAPAEFALFCRESGHALQNSRKDGSVWVITILRG